MLCLNETINQLAMANSVRWYVHVLMTEDVHVLRRALDFEAEDQREKVSPKRTWKRQVEKESVKVGLRREDILCRSKWSFGVNMNDAGLKLIWSPSLVEILLRFNHWCVSLTAPDFPNCVGLRPSSSVGPKFT